MESIIKKCYISPRSIIKKNTPVSQQLPKHRVGEVPIYSHPKKPLRKSKTKYEDINLGEIVNYKSPTNRNNNRPEHGLDNNTKDTNLVKQSGGTNTKQVIKKRVQISPKTKTIISPRSTTRVSPKPTTRVSPKPTTRVSPKSTTRVSPKSTQKSSPNKYNISRRVQKNKVVNHKQNIIDKYCNTGLDTIKKPRKYTKIPKNNIIKNPYIKVKVRTNLKFFKELDYNVNPDFLEKNIHNLKYFDKMKYIEDRYIGTVLSDSININKFS